MSDTNPIPNMSDVNPVADVKQTSFVDIRDKNPVSDILCKSSSVDVADKCPVAEKSNAFSVSGSHNKNLISEPANLSPVSSINLSPDSDIIELGPENISKPNPVSEMSETNPVTDMSEESSVIDLTETNLVDMSETSSVSDDMSEENYINMIPEIPDLDLSSDEEELLSTPKGEERIELVGFDLKPYTLPDTERYGNCRLISEFDKLTYVGEGACGIVYKVLDKKYGTIVALKKMKISLKDEEPLSIPVIREINLLRHFEHPNIVNSRGIAVGRNFDSTYLILDYCDYDLSKVIDDEKSSIMLEEPQIKCIMLQLFDGLKYIHKNGVLHRDLSCSNVLFTSEGVLKIGDFGLARSVDLQDAMTPDVVSRWYRAPEILLGSTHYSFAIDVWSAGCIFAELVLKKPLFKADSDMNMITGIIDLFGTPTEAIWPGLSQLPVMEAYELKTQPENNLKTLFAEQSEASLDLLNKLFTYDPKKRISAAAAFSHSYFYKDPHACSPGDLVDVLKVTDEIKPE